MSPKRVVRLMSRRGTVFVFVAMAVSVAVVSALNYLGTSDRERISALAEQTCNQVEHLKAELRDRARDNFRNLERDARLLGIALTPELRATARESRDDTLRRFKPIDC